MKYSDCLLYALLSDSSFPCPWPKFNKINAYYNGRVHFKTKFILILGHSMPNHWRIVRPPQILMKPGALGVPRVLITHTDF